MINDLKSLVSPMGVKKKNKKQTKKTEAQRGACSCQGHTAQQLIGGWTGERQG